MNDDHYAILTQKQGIQQDFPDGHPFSYHPRPTGLNFGAQTEQIIPFGVSRTLTRRRGTFR